MGGDFQYRYLKECENYDLKSVVKIRVYNINKTINMLGTMFQIKYFSV